MKHTCKVKKLEDDRRSEVYERLLQLQLEENNKKYAKLEKDHEQLRRDMEKMKKQISQKGSNVINNNNSNVNINNGVVNHNHITLIGYGQEDLSKMSKNELLKVFRCGFNSTLQLTETMHFNPNYPEFHNVYISSMKNKYAMMYDGSEWTLVMKEELIDKLYDDKRDYIEENLDDFLDSLTPSQQRALHRWMNAGDTHPYIRKIKNDIKLMLYNKRKLPLNNTISKIEIDEELDLDNLITTVDTKIESESESESETIPKVIKMPKHDNVKSRMKEPAGRPGTKRKNIKTLKKRR